MQRYPKIPAPAARRLRIAVRIVLVSFGLLAVGAGTPLAAQNEALAPAAISLPGADASAGPATGILVSPFAEYLFDPGARLSVEDFLQAPDGPSAREWRALPDGRANFGFRRGAVWLRFRVHNPARRPAQFYLEAQYPMLDDLRLYAPPGARAASGTGDRTRAFSAATEERATGVDHPAAYALVRRTGDRLVFNRRDADFQRMVFRTGLAPASEGVFYIRAESESSMNAGLVLWTPDAFADYSRRTTLVLSMLYAVLAVMLLFNLLLFVSLLERAYLYFTAYLLAISLFLFTLDGLSFQYLWPDSPDWGNISLPLWMNLSYIAGLVFARHYLRTARDAPFLDRVILVEVGAAALLAVGVFFVSYTYSIIAATALAAGVALSVIAATFAGVLQRRRSAYYFGLAWTMVLAGILFYSLKTFAIVPDSVWANRSIHIGVVLQVVLLSLGLADRINGLRLDLKHRLAELRAAGRSIRSQEKKYEHLVESSGDIIFSLDQDGVFLTANRAIQATLGLRPRELVGASFISLLYRSPELDEIMPDADFQHELIARELKELIATGNPVVFKAELSTKLGEPRQLEVRLERVASSAPEREEYVIFGKAAVVLEDAVMRFVESERQVHVIGNFLNIADLITERIVKNLEKFTDSAAKLSIHICVREMIINAIEHGNLAVNYEEKTQATDREVYMQLLLARQKDPRYRDRKVTVSYALNRHRVWYRIRDEGTGFDHRKLFAQNPDAPNSAGLAHGRGITMARNIFDFVRYNDAGNQVTLIKRF